MEVVELVSTSTLRLSAAELEVALLLVGRDHRISFANASAHQMLGYPSGGLHGLPLERLIPPSRLGELQNVDAVLAGQAPRRVRSLVTRANGAVMDVSLTLDGCRDDEGAVVAVSLRYEPLARLSTGPSGLDPERVRAEPGESGMRVDGARVRRLLGDQVSGALTLLASIEDHLSRAHRDARAIDQARAVLHEARDLLEDCELDLMALAPQDAALPTPPRLPRHE